MVIQHNMAAMNTQRQNKINRDASARHAERLSSGYRINRAADDAAGLSISEKMRRQIRGLDQGAENIQDGISVCKVMDGALTEAHDILHRMTELSVKSANGTWSPAERNDIEMEIRQLRAELDRLTANTTFNELQLLSAVDLEINSALGSDSGGKADIIFVIDNTGSMPPYVNNVKNNLHSFANGLLNCNVQYGIVEYGEFDGNDFPSLPLTSSTTDVMAYLNRIHCDGGGDENEAALEALAQAGRFPFRTDAAVKEVILITDAPYHDANDDGLSNLHDADVASFLQGQGIHLSVVTTPAYQSKYEENLAKDGNVFDLSNNFYDSFMDIARGVADTVGETFHKNPADIIIQMNGDAGNTSTIRTYNVTSTTLGLSEVSCLTRESSSAAIDMIGNANDIISRIRSEIGAEQNTLEHAYNNNTNISENTSAAESRIRDADMASEMVIFSMLNILKQAGDSMLSQASKKNQDVLNLLT